MEKTDFLSRIDLDHNYFRLTYKGSGIYEALKDIVGWKWATYKLTKAFTWLPVPPEYGLGCQSWFTKLGFTIFITKTLPLMLDHMHEELIEVEYLDEVNLDSITYEDEYQLVVKLEHIWKRT